MSAEETGCNTDNLFFADWATSGSQLRFQHKKSEKKDWFKKKRGRSEQKYANPVAWVLCTLEELELLYFKIYMHRYFMSGHAQGFGLQCDNLCKNLTLKLLSRQSYMLQIQSRLKSITTIINWFKISPAAVAVKCWRSKCDLCPNDIAWKWYFYEKKTGGVAYISPHQEEETHKQDARSVQLNQTL